MKIVSMLTLVVFLAGLAGCAIPKPLDKQPSTLTAGKVDLHLKKGVTTKNEVLKAFGSPNIVTKNREADEVWNYNRMSYSTQVDAGTLTFWGGSRAVSTTTNKSFDLMIIFDSNGIVKDFSVIQANF